ncbi:toxin RelE [Spirochaetia bacterium]|nr:toxin RelE [Spirochaetia bacterium]
MYEWEVNNTEEYDTWFLQQSEEDQVILQTRVFLLKEHGPQLGRPYADTLKGSSLRNLKELRAKTEAHMFRVAYLFDPEQKALLLIGGDKKGKNEKRFYKGLIKQAEQIYDLYREKKEQKNG